jgi:hypothetical protein
MYLDGTANDPGREFKRISSFVSLVLFVVKYSSLVLLSDPSMLYGDEPKKEPQRLKIPTGDNYLRVSRPCLQGNFFQYPR